MFSIHDPDGVPHQVVALNLVLALAVAIGSFAALTIGGVVSVLALVVVPGLILALGRYAGGTRARRVPAAHASLRRPIDFVELR
jgi:hypothetical protein